MDFMKLMEQRHSVRQYTNQAIEPEKQAILNNTAAQINQEQGLHIQIFYNEPQCFDSFMARYGKFSGVQNYIALVGKKSETLEETLGYYGEQLVLLAQELGLHTCWVAMTHGKSKAIVEKGEKQVCLIALGYSCTSGAAHKSKAVEEVSNYRSGMPEWFLDGVKAALLAPTAMNQQKFRLELQADGETVRSSCGTGFYTKLDLGIVNYHFAAVTGKDCE